MTKFPQRLKESRKASGFTLKGIAKLLSISHVSYLRWEQGKTQPSIESIIKLCDILDVSSDYLLGRKEV